MRVTISPHPNGQTDRSTQPQPCPNDEVALVEGGTQMWRRGFFATASECHRGQQNEMVRRFCSHTESPPQISTIAKSQGKVFDIDFPLGKSIKINSQTLLLFRDRNS